MIIILENGKLKNEPWRKSVGWNILPVSNLTYIIFIQAVEFASLLFFVGNKILHQNILPFAMIYLQFNTT